MNKIMFIPFHVYMCSLKNHQYQTDTEHYHQMLARTIVKLSAVVLEKANHSQQKLLWVR